MAATGHADTKVGHGELIDAVDRALTAHGRAILTGPAGAGKTEVARAVAAAAHRRRETVLRLAPEAADRSIPEASAAALLASVPATALDRLAGPQRTAIAQLRREADAPGADRDHVALRLAVGEVLRTLAEPGPVLLVLDNAQWLDAESTDLLRFALRLTPPRVRVLAAECVQGGAPVAEPLCGAGTPTIRVPALGADEVAELLLRHGLPARLAGRIHQASGGNPRLALALGHSLAEAGAAATGPGGGAHHADPCPSPAGPATSPGACSPKPPNRPAAPCSSRPSPPDPPPLLRRAGRPTPKRNSRRPNGPGWSPGRTAPSPSPPAPCRPPWPPTPAGPNAPPDTPRSPPPSTTPSRRYATARWPSTPPTRHSPPRSPTRPPPAAAAAARPRRRTRTPGRRTHPWARPSEELARLVAAAEDAGWAAAPTSPAAPPAPYSPATPPPPSAYGPASPSSTPPVKPWPTSTRPSPAPSPTPRATPPYGPPSNCASPGSTTSATATPSAPATPPPEPAPSPRPAGTRSPRPWH
ncbi:ATP-binding protein [Streptomyces sp. RerS4]|uniref:ATP-binding protein n=1 Tax=Streptomyces sp. RerS4 TaxID=2942449 RepID=UPI00201C6BDB|nr:ATP-binding protein [Streptomyces sp. RerS4]UQW99727.1 ATP-binding protein [Streptomyces sp. RerS4]